jgi:transcriptional regulator with XRE-family HTH domain
MLIRHLPADRKRLGLREVQMAGRLGLTLREYRALELGELHISSDLYERICEVCGWPMESSRVTT